jgi:hypothetical protein
MINITMIGMDIGMNLQGILQRIGDRILGIAQVGMRSDEGNLEFPAWGREKGQRK